MSARSPQLLPFTFIKDIMVTTNLNLKNSSTYLSFLKTPTVYTVIFNLFLLFPFGIYLHYYFEKKWYQVLIMSFCLSLFFEITQLTGIFFIYPKAYRLFDIDDLMTNTLGGMLGFICTKPLTIFLPSRKELDQKAYTKGTKISIYRRGIALFIDLFLAFCFSTPIWVLFGGTISFGTFYSITLFLYEVLFPLLDNGRTIGKRFVNIRLKCVNESDCFSIRLIFRQAILYLFILRIPSYLSYLSRVHLENNGLEFLITFGKLLMLSYYLYFIYESFLNILGKRKNFNYERICSVTNSSLIMLQDDKNMIE